jgi:hypothetical protein
MKIIIPVSSIVAIFVLFGMLSFFNDINRETKEGDMKGVSEVVTDRVVSETESELQDAILAPFVPYIVGIIVFIAGLLGVKLIIK